MKLKDRTLSIVCAVLVCLLAWVPASEAEEGRDGDIGGAPTIALGPPDEGKRTTPDVVIGRGRDFEGPVELVAYGWEMSEFAEAPQRGVCIWATYLPSREVVFQGCLLTQESRAGGPQDVITSTGKLQPKSERWTQFGGRISPDISTVRVAFQRPHRDGRFRVHPIVARVDGDLQKELKMPEAFGFFTVRVAGLVPRRMFTVKPIRVRPRESLASSIGYWEDCGPAAEYQPITVLAHHVSCRKARETIRKSWVVGQRQGEAKTIHVNKFRCRIRNGAKRMIACRHASQRILGPLPS